MARPFHNRKRRAGDKGDLQLYPYPGKFEGELLVAAYLCDNYESDETDSEGDGGAYDEIFRGPFRGPFDDAEIPLTRAEKRYLKYCAGAITHTRSDGFVSVRFYPNTKKGCERLEGDWQEVQFNHELMRDPEEPEDGDYTTRDYREFFQYGKLVLTVEEDDDWRAAVKTHMDEAKFWPDVWFISDHGNPHLLTLEDE